ncbi:hypothetical protein NT05HA_0304 [Aggregatibacter aphrophilus NJ8700]|nr:hypothetical protein NT05HA_0304 [Aggregatibacter aphrophilus NJ8700]
MMSLSVFMTKQTLKNSAENDKFQTNVAIIHINLRSTC